jgi:hypothetical protein
MPRDWTLLTDDAQLYLAREALARAAALIADQAEFLAGEIEAGVLNDRGGADALRLLAALVRLNGPAADGSVVGQA